MNPSLESTRSILITGCSSGIGHATAHALKKRGYRVFATARRERDVDRLREEGLEALQLDVADPASIAAAVHTVLSRTDGRLDALFNNAGYGQPGAVEDLSRDLLRRQFETNLFGPQELTNAVLPAMRRQGHGRIVYNSSVLGLAALPFRGAYNASKFAMEGLVDTLRMELLGSGIHAALIEPGPITSLFSQNAYKAFQANIDREHSAHRRAYHALDRRLSGRGKRAPFKQGPDAVIRRLVHALESPRPRARYYVTKPTYLFGFLRRVLSTAALDAVLLRSTAYERKPPEPVADETGSQR